MTVLVIPVSVFNRDAMLFDFGLPISDFTGFPSNWKSGLSFLNNLLLKIDLEF